MSLSAIQARNQAIGAANEFTRKSLDGLGALKGANLEVTNIVYNDTDNRTEVEVSWTSNSGSVETDKIYLPYGVSVVSVRVDDEGKNLIFTNSKGVDLSPVPLPENLKVKISKADGNILEEKADGLYVPATGIEISKEDGNKLSEKADGLYASGVDISADANNAIEKKDDGLYVPNTAISTDVPIKSISVNGQGVVPVNKNVNIDVPTKTSQLENDSNFASTTDIPTKLSQLENDSNFASTGDIPTKTSQLTNDSSFVTESNLTAKNYADKTYVGEQIAQSEHLKREIVTVLPEPTVADEHTIYMLKDDSVQGNDKFKEYMLIEGVVQCVGDTSVDLTDYVKTNELPTELPANGGNSDTVNNHTVKSDVPENAVFTDTIYDDTEVKGSIAELSSNLDELSYSDNGIENLCNPNKIERGLYTSTDTRVEHYFHYEIEVTPNEYYSRTRFDGLTDYSGYCFSILDENKNCIVVFANNERTIQIPSNGAYLWLQGGESAEQLKNMKYMVVKLQTPPTDYKPYIPSVKMLAEENAQQNTEAMDLKMLGWTVPEECPIQNYTDSDGVFHQRVGRVDLGSLEWTYDTLWKATSGVSTIKNLTVNMYHSVYVPTIANVSDMPTNSVKKADSDTLWINNGSSTEKPNGYLYFELATEKTIKVDGNEAVTKVNDSLGALGKCKNLLNPTLETTTVSGVTCTNNGDGTYTLNGTCTKDDAFILKNNIKINGSYRLVGCPKGEYSLWITSGYPEWVIIGEDTGNGSNFTSSSDFLFDVRINIYENRTYNNVVFKPMLTTNLSATYDDFVPYTGDGETLTHDVAEIKKDLAVKKFELVAGVLWLCVSGKHCVLTLNGYNLTEPTHFDKLEEYQPYLVARNVVSNGDSVCIAAVEPNGNINASDLTVGTSLTGQLFGEVSWIANI